MRLRSEIYPSGSYFKQLKTVSGFLRNKASFLLQPVTRYCFIVTCLVFHLSHSLSAQIQVAFSADVTSGCSPISVTFSNQSLPLEGSTYLWDFGNGNFSTATNPQTTYIQPGMYPVSLTVTNNGISETLTKEGFITVYTSPEANFELIGDTIGCSPSAFAFTNLSSDPGGSSLSHIWSFGDGGKSTEENPVHSYSTKGVFDVTLLVENQYGCFDSYTKSQLVHVFKPVAQFGADKTNSCDGVLLTAFNNISEGENPLIASWDFGDGAFSNEFAPEHHYETPGAYSVKLVIEDSYGCTDEITRQDLIQIVKTTASFTVSSDTLCPGQNLVLTNKSAYADQYLWKFGDQTTSTAVNTSKKFNQSGDYTIWLIASRGNCIDSLSKDINIEYVKADFTPADSFLCELPVILNYTDKSVNAVAWDWRFGNGTVSQLQNPSVTYPASTRLTNHTATFSDTLIVTSKHGCTHRLIRENSVMIQIPDVKFSPGSGGDADQLNFCIPATLTFSDQTEYTSPYDYITEKQWFYKSQPAGNADQLEISVTETGEIPIELTIVTAKGCVQKKTETINAGQKLEPDFYRVGDYSVCASQSVDFIVTAPEPSLITNGSWDFGDESEDMLQMPPHNFVKTGPMDVTFTVLNYGCESSVTKKNIVNIMGPLASFEAVIDCNKPYERVLQATIEEASEFTWDLGDNSPIINNQNNFAHTFEEKGEYNITLTANNATNGCAYEFSRTLFIRDVNSSFEITDGTPCFNNVLTLDGSKSVDAIDHFLQNDYGKYLWHIEEENQTYFTSEPLIHKFTKKGIHNVSLIVQDINGCTDTLRQEIMIYKPEPDFNANYKLGCMPVSFEFTDLSQSEAPITNWLWNFGDGLTSSDQNPVHDYTSFGNYNVSLKVTDEIGCSSTLVKNQIVKAIFPDASFKAYDNTLCPGDSSSFSDLSASEIVDYLWETSDGKTSNLEKPLFYFNNPGFYSVNLKVTDNHGCEASHYLENYIHVQPFPKADFSADITNSNCYPLIVQFVDESENEFPGSWEWHFGENDNLSEIKNPFFIYNRPGDHTVRLINRTSYGCADTIVKPQFIHVGGPFATVTLNDTVCQNLDVPFVAENLLNVYDIRWDFGDGYSATGNQVVHQYRNAGTVYPVMFVRSDAENTCNKAIIDTLNVLDLQARFRLKDEINRGCVPFSPSLINESINATEWLWDFGNGTIITDKTPAYQFPDAGTYNMRLIALHTLGCRDTTDWKQIIVDPLPTVKTSNDTIICVGTSALLSAGGGLSYSWIPPETLLNPNDWRTVANPGNTTLYQVQVTDENGCINFGDVLVSVQQRPVITLNDTTLIIGESLALDVSDPGISSYFWSPSEYISCTLCPNPVIQPMKSTAYQVAVTDTSNCFTVNYPINITILEKYSVDVPDAFTPNGDGVNDRIFVKGWGIKALINFKIYNRLGQEVYSSSELDEGWDGTFRGKAQPSETYNYIVEVKTFDDKTRSKSGVFKLLR